MLTGRHASYRRRSAINARQRQLAKLREHLEKRRARPVVAKPRMSNADFQAKYGHVFAQLTEEEGRTDAGADVDVTYRRHWTLTEGPHPNPIVNVLRRVVIAPSAGDATCGEPMGGRRTLGSHAG